jgi:hypothetical protein
MDPDSVNSYLLEPDELKSIKSLSDQIAVYNHIIEVAQEMREELMNKLVAQTVLLNNVIVNTAQAQNSPINKSSEPCRKVLRLAK